MTSTVAAEEVPQTYTKNNPFSGSLSNNYKLSKEGSGKETRHFEISIAGSGIKYKCGDALAILPHNDQEFVNEFLKIGGYSGDEDVTLAGDEKKSLKNTLIENLNLHYISGEFLKQMHAVCENSDDKVLLDKFTDPGYKKEFKENYFDVMDVMMDVPHTRLGAQALVDNLKVLKARLYSIASSPTKHPDEIHLCIVVNNTTLKGRLRKGVASNFISHGVPTGGTVKVYIQPNKHFVLPAVKNTPIIMVGPGTGIAPFRAYLQERQAVGDEGKNWLFFGEQKKDFDFLYGEEFTGMEDSGFLTRFDTAFSRDQAHKIYVQDKMRENSAELYKWLEEGASFYVCGDAKRMAVDVDNALHDVIQSEGDKSEDEAKAYVKAMKKEKRYVRDIY